MSVSERTKHKDQIIRWQSLHKDRLKAHRSKWYNNHKEDAIARSKRRYDTVVASQKFYCYDCEKILLAHGRERHLSTALHCKNASALLEYIKFLYI